MSKLRQVQGGDGDRHIFSEGRKGPGGAYNQYGIGIAGKVPGVVAYIDFQIGCARKKGWNGCTDADLIAIEMDRFEGFQTGPSACDENVKILKHLDQIKKLLKQREHRVTVGKS